MIRYAIGFFVIALIAGVLGLTGVMALAADVAWIFLLIAVVFMVISLFKGKKPAS